ncbi:hypothetical protein D3C84_1292460 [compost metagenome]
MSASITETPARHRERLGEAADENRAIFHARHRSKADVLLARERKLRINLVGNND